MIIFTDLAVRLVDGPDSATGRVEVYYNGTWGTVCHDLWDINDAHVVCRQLGFLYALNAYYGARYGRGTGPILLDSVKCGGFESSLFSCGHDGVGIYDYCDHSEDASVRCGNTGGENIIDDGYFHRTINYSYYHESSLHRGLTCSAITMNAGILQGPVLIKKPKKTWQG